MPKASSAERLTQATAWSSITHEGPRVPPGYPQEMLYPTSYIKSRHLARNVPSSPTAASQAVHQA